MEDFKSNTTLEERKFQSRLIMAKHPTRVPIYVYKHAKSKYQDINKHKYLVPKDITVGQFIYIIRKQLSVKPDQAIFVFVDNVLPPTAALMSQLYTDHADPDGFLYITFSHENVFG